MAQYATYPSLRSKVVIITGGAEGIGAATATTFAHQGSKVVIFDISPSSATKLIETIRSDATDTTHLPIFYECDVTDLAKLKACADTALQTFGHVDVLVNNAAAVAGKQGTFDIDAESWERNINVNLRHLFFLTQYLAPSMKTHGGGAIINMGSITWRVGAAGMPLYTTCKAAVHGLTRTHAREFGPDNIRVNSIMPGFIGTERQIRDFFNAEFEAETMRAQALKRILRPEEAARVIAFLASDDASGITGSSYCVDAGWVSDP